MAQIQEYLPETQAQEPVGGVSPNVELAGSVGRGLQNLGESVTQGAMYVHRKNAQEETADVYANIASSRAEWTSRVQDEVQNGTLDVEKLKNDFDEQTQKLGDNLQTSEGRNYFERQQARLRGAVLHQATVGASQVAARNAVDSWTRAVGTNSSVLMRDPSQFKDLYDQGLETVDQMIQTGGLPEKMRDKAINEMAKEYSRGAIRGWMDVDPDKAEKIVRAGAFDQFMNSDDKQKMLNEIKTAQGDSMREDSRAAANHLRQMKASEEKIYADNFEALTTGRLSPSKITEWVRSGQIRPQEGEAWRLMMDKANRQESVGNPRKFNELANLTQDPDNPITSTRDPRVMDALRKGQINVDGKYGMNRLDALIAKTPEGKAQLASEKDLFAAAKRQMINTGQGSISSTLAESKLAQFKQDYAAAKLKAGNNASDLTDQKNPSNWYLKIDQYVPTIKENLEWNQTHRTQRALQTTPKDVQEGKKPKDDSALRPGESLMDNLKRNKDF